MPQKFASTGLVRLVIGLVFGGLAFVSLLTSNVIANDAFATDGWLVEYLEADQALLTEFQPPPNVQPTRPPTRVEQPPTGETARTDNSRRRRRPRRLGDAPDMFGDLITRGLVHGVNSNDDPFEATFPFGRTSKISEHNGVLPDHRVLFLYNHFHNSQRTLSAASSPEGEWTKSSLDRYTVGVEHPFIDDLWSVELRMAFLGQSSQATDDFSISGGDYGNLAVILKRLVYEDDQLAVAIGMGIDLPTGSAIQGEIPFDSYALRVHNQAVHLLPYIGFLSTPSDRLFIQGFAQVDVAMNGNKVELSGDGSFPFIEDGVLTEQNFLYLDIAAGYWLFQNPGSDWLTGLAANLELHYSRTLQNRDIVDLSGVMFESGRTDGLDILNFTLGLQAVLANSTNVRVGAVFPFELDGEACFDAELQAAVVQRF